MQPFPTSPRDARSLGAYARAAGLSWVSRWGWAPGVVVDAVGQVGGKSRGLAKSLCDSGLLRLQPWEHSAHVRGYYFITPKGLDALEELFDQAQESARKFDYPKIQPPPKKIPTFKTGIAVHDLFVQALAAIALIDSKHGKAIGYKTTVEMAGMRKIPDCVIERQGGKDEFIEFEYSKKNRSEIENFLIAYYLMLNESGRENDNANIYFASTRLMQPFSRSWKEGAILSQSNRNELGQWKRELIPVELPDGTHLDRLHMRVVSWSKLVAQLASLPKLEPARPAPPRLW